MKENLLAMLCALLCACATSPTKSNHAEFKAGAAKVKITPQHPTWLSGYAGRNQPAHGPATDLFARAVALQDADGQRLVIVSIEVLGLPRSMNEMIRAKAREQFGLREHQLMLVATHTHKGPVLPERPSIEIMYDLDAEQTRRVMENAAWLEQQILEAIGTALRDLEPVRLTFGRGRCGFAINRRVATARGMNFGENRNGPVDHDVPVLWARRLNGAEKAILFGYACHCTTLGGEYNHYHGDYAGAAMSELETRFGGIVAAFLTGCGGDANPSPRGTPEIAEQLGRVLAESVARIIGSDTSGAVTAPLIVHYIRTELPLDTLPTREQWRELENDRDAYVARHARENLKLLDAGRLPSVVPYPIQTVRFGDQLEMAALGGEVVVDYALRLKRERYAEKLWVIAYANEVPCYIPSRRILEEGGYEAGWGARGRREFAGGSMIYYGWPAPLSPVVESKIISFVHSLLDGTRVSAPGKRLRKLLSDRP